MSSAHFIITEVIRKILLYIFLARVVRIQLKNLTKIGGLKSDGLFFVCLKWWEKVFYFHSDLELIKKCIRNFPMIQRNSGNTDSVICSDLERFENQWEHYCENLVNQHKKMFLFKITKNDLNQFCCWLSARYGVISQNNLSQQCNLIESFLIIQDVNRSAHICISRVIDAISAWGSWNR